MDGSTHPVDNSAIITGALETIAEQLEDLAQMTGIIAESSSPEEALARLKALDETSAIES